jgi:hypothetical protein
MQLYGAVGHRGRKIYLFAGSDAGGERAAVIYGLLGSAKLNGVDPEAHLAAVLYRVADHPINRIAELLPWNPFPPARLPWRQPEYPMTWLPLESKMFLSAVYDAKKRNLYLCFRSGNVYGYFQFSKDDYQHFPSAESKGHHFLGNIRDCFPYERMAKLQVA